MHLAALAAMIALYAAASLTGAGVGAPEAFKLSDLAPHLLLTHAWGRDAKCWLEFPSWSISAEWAAYLLFPLFAGLVLKTRRAAWMLAGALALCLGSFYALDHLHQLRPFWQVGREFSQMTAQIGVLRIMPSFVLGIAIYAFSRNTSAPAWAAWPIVAVSALWIIAVSTFNLWEALTWFGFAGLLFGLSETARHGVDKPMAGDRFVFLGAASYALYMTHLPVDIVWFHALEKFGIDENASVLLRSGALVGVFGACILVSVFAYLWLEEPARKWIRGLSLPQRKPASVVPKSAA